MINVSTNTVIANIPVGSYHVGVAYNPSNGYVYVTNWASSNVSVINGATNTVIGSIFVGSYLFLSYPVGVAYDSSNGYVYVANSKSGTVSVISTSPQVIKKVAPCYSIIYIIIVIVVIIAVLGVVMAMRRDKNKGKP